MNSIVKNKIAEHKKKRNYERGVSYEIPMRKIGKHQENLAHAVAFLCSPAAFIYKGINFPVDGGRLSCL